MLFTFPEKLTFLGYMVLPLQRCSVHTCLSRTTVRSSKFGIFYSGVWCDWIPLLQAYMYRFSRTKVKSSKYRIFNHGVWCNWMPLLSVYVHKFSCTAVECSKYWIFNHAATECQYYQYTYMHLVAPWLKVSNIELSSM